MAQLLSGQPPEPEDTFRGETLTFQRETGEPAARTGESVTLSVSLLSIGPTILILWRAACFSISGSLCLLRRLVCLAAEERVAPDRHGERRRGKVKQSGTHSERTRLRRAVGAVFPKGQTASNSGASDFRTRGPYPLA